MVTMGLLNMLEGIESSQCVRARGKEDRASWSRSLPLLDSNLHQHLQQQHPFKRRVLCLR